ncbi:hypothetical protein MCNF_46750 [Mycolicibacterium confluentis]|uniref:Uncharacterized protein n=1 Tax=Mycolicibacterium confluentis TaxID=28047 RepID=A0A7I7Y2Z7_9MYCO|nr:hypothetical protein MCNF_46750 [Mycolicibacterium confluentis]
MCSVSKTCRASLSVTTVATEAASAATAHSAIADRAHQDRGVGFIPQRVTDIASLVSPFTRVYTAERLIWANDTRNPQRAAGGEATWRRT